jgi:drug/metabolite transporter (DMT)-like permease
VKGLPPALLAVGAAGLSSFLGGSAIVATRFVVPEAGVLPVVFLRFAGAGLLMLAFTLPRTGQPVKGGDMPALVGLGLVQFALFPWLFTSSLALIPAARAALVLSTQPLVTLAFAVIAGRERLTVAKVAGGLLALAAVGFALSDQLSDTGPHAWRGDMYMFGAVVSGSLYNVASSFALRRHRARVAGAVMVPVGAVAAGVALLWQGEAGTISQIGASGWLALAYLMSLGGAVTFFLWIWALEHTTPSRVALAVTLNPVSAAILGAAVLAEPLGWRLVVGLAGIVAALVLVNWHVIAAGLRNRPGG